MTTRKAGQQIDAKAEASLIQREIGKLQPIVAAFASDIRAEDKKEGRTLSNDLALYGGLSRSMELSRALTNLGRMKKVSLKLYWELAELAQEIGISAQSYDMESDPRVRTATGLIKKVRARLVLLMSYAPYQPGVAASPIARQVAFETEVWKKTSKELWAKYSSESSLWHKVGWGIDYLENYQKEAQRGSYQYVHSALLSDLASVMKALQAFFAQHTGDPAVMQMKRRLEASLERLRRINSK